MAEEKVLSQAEQAWIEKLLSQWGAWEFEGLDKEKKLSVLAKLMQSVEGDPKPTRQMCDDQLGFLINAVVHYYVRKLCPNDYKYLEAKYIYALSERQIAQYVYSNAPEEKLLGKWKKPSYGTVRSRVKKSLINSEWIVAKFLNSALKNHENAVYFRKFAFFA